MLAGTPRLLLSRPCRQGKKSWTVASLEAVCQSGQYVHEKHIEVGRLGSRPSCRALFANKWDFVQPPPCWLGSSLSPLFCAQISITPMDQPPTPPQEVRLEEASTKSEIVCKSKNTCTHREEERQSDTDCFVCVSASTVTKSWPSGRPK